MSRLADREGQATLLFGAQAIPRDRIASYAVSKSAGWPIIGMCLIGGFFLVLAASLASSVASGDGLTPRWLIGAGFLTFLGIAALSEIPLIKPQGLIKLKIWLDDGSQKTFTSPDQHDIDVLIRQMTDCA